MRFFTRVPLALAMAVLLPPGYTAGAQELGNRDPRANLTAYATTMAFGTGLINTPVAWVSPDNGDLFATLSARAFNQGTLAPRPNGSVWDMTTNIEAHLMGRLAVGASLFSTYNQQIGIHSRLLLARQSIDSKWMPNFSIGFRNLGSSPLQDRYVSGDRRVRDILPAAQRAGAGVINGAPSFYGVATREFTGDRTSLGLTMGYGTGLFRNDGGLGTKYNKGGTLVPGLFLGGRYAVALSDKSTLGLMLENDAWDWNVGAHVTMGHLTVGVMLAEVEEAKGIPPGEPLANWTKTNLMVAYSGSIPDIVRNSRQRSESVELELEAQRLKREVAQRARRMRELQRDIAGAQTRADADAKAQEAALLKALDAEREAAKRAAERLKAVKPDGKPDGTP